MAVKKGELSCTIPQTTTLRLFEYPHKYGGKSWCVGFERSHKNDDGSCFVSQTFLSDWSEDRAAELVKYNRWRAILGIR